MRSIGYIPVLFTALLIGCHSKSSTESQSVDSANLMVPKDSVIQSSSNPDVDSILRNFDIAGPIKLIEKRYVENDAQYAFIIPRARTDQHKRLDELFVLSDSELRDYRLQYQSMKKDSLKAVAPPKEIKGDWLPVFWYRDDPYVVLPCEEYTRYIFTDSTFVQCDMDATVPEPITGVIKNDAKISLETANGKKYSLELKDPGHSIYLLSGDQKAYIIPLSKAAELPIIIEHCTVDGGIDVEYQLAPPGDQ